MPRALVWFRDDLRLDDHLALEAALAACPEGTVLLHVFDPRVWAPARGLGLELPRLGARRALFWRQAVASLRVEVRSRGGELVVRVGDPAEVVPEVASSVGAEAVFAQAHVTHDEVRDEGRVREALAASSRRLVLTPGRTLVHIRDLPFALEELPDVFTPFRKKVEAKDRFRSPVPAPSRLPAPPPELALGDIPSQEELGSFEPPEAEAALLPMVGGEREGRARLESWTFEARALGTYKETRNGILHADESSKFSPWLAHGCLSPRRVLEAVRRYEDAYGANESTYWLIFELLWRDYFAFLAAREGSRLFLRSGVGRRDLPFKMDTERFRAWCDGQTGFPFVDAFMRELTATGFMSNRGRQNVASFLAKSLGVDWRWGAAWFEAHLIDYDPASNWGNWQYAAGVGTDPRDRIFNVVKQARDYDPGAEFVRTWVPEVRAWADGRAHEPWLEGGVPNYPEPIIAPRFGGPPRRGSAGRGRGRRG